VDLSSEEWVLCDVAMATVPRQRFAGLHAGGVEAMLFWTRSVNTLSMRRAIGVAHIDLNGLVTASIAVDPRRVVTTAAKRWVLEVRNPRDLPPVRSMVTVVPSSDDAWNTCALCNTYWESRRCERAAHGDTQGRRRDIC
jgi:hypothetical protein